MLAEIQALNTIAVGFIGDGNHREAIEVLQHVITELSGCMLDPTPIGPTTDLPHSHSFTNNDPLHPSSAGISIYAWEARQRQKLQQQRQADVADDKANAPNGGDSYTFVTHAFMFECDEVEDEAEDYIMNEKATREADDDVSCCIGIRTMTEQEYYSCAVTCLFNLGLCYQLEWSERQQNRRIQTYCCSSRWNANQTETTAITTDNKPDRFPMDALLTQSLACFDQAFSLTHHVQRMLRSNDPIMRVLTAIAANAAYSANQLGWLGHVHLWNHRLCHVLHYAATTTMSTRMQSHDNCPSFYHLHYQQASDQRLYMFYLRQAFYNRYCGTAAQAA